MLQYQPFSPVDIRFADMQSFEELLQSLAGENTLALVSKGTLKRLEAYGGAVKLIREKSSCIISDIHANPSVEDLCSQLNMLQNKGRFGCILAIGGGSTIDLAKAVSALQGMAAGKTLEYGDITEAIDKKKYFEETEPADIIAVPTTAGTGSEVTKWATIWDFHNRKKLSVEHEKCFPKAAVIIPELTASMPKRLTLAAGLDALSHAMEGFWAKKRNTLSQTLALDSIAHIKVALPAALKHPDDLTARKEMCLGSLLAGLSFSLTKTTACHSISYPLTMRFGVEHGFAAALSLAEMLRINLEAVPELNRVLKLFDGTEGFSSWLHEVSDGIQELKLSAFGIKSEDVEKIAGEAFTLGRMDNNPIPMDKELVKEVLNNLL